MGMGMGLGMGMGMPNPFGKSLNPQEMGERVFGGAPGGMLPRRGDARWQAVRREERDALYQKYAGKLPPEYREMLKAYYEKLSN
jgi:hypothetical protein